MHSYGTCDLEVSSQLKVNVKDNVLEQDILFGM